MFHWGRPPHMIIRSSSLKTLVIESRDNDVSDELTISAPKLEGLYIYGGGYTNCSVMDAFSLKNVVLGLEEGEERDDEYEDEDEDEEEGGRSELFAETLRQILPAIQYAQTVNLSMDCCKVLSLMPCGVPSFSKVKLLNVTSFPIYELEDIAGILETFPNLESLIIHSYGNCNDNVWKQSRNLEPLLLHLRTIVVVSWRYEDSLFGFIVSLLKHATEVRQIVIRNDGDWRDGSKYKEMVQKHLPVLHASFPKLRIISYPKCIGS